MLLLIAALHPVMTNDLLCGKLIDGKLIDGKLTLNIIPKISSMK